MGQELQYGIIHRAIHDPDCSGVYLDGKYYKIDISKYNKCRYIDYDGIRFMEQNKNKTLGDHKTLTESAQKARDGAKITWGMRPGKWIKIET